MKPIIETNVLKNAYSVRYLDPKEWLKLPWKNDFDRPFFMSAFETLDNSGTRLGYVYVGVVDQSKEGRLQLGVVSKSGKIKSLESNIKAKTAMKIHRDYYYRQKIKSSWLDILVCTILWVTMISFSFLFIKDNTPERDNKAATAEQMQSVHELAEKVSAPKKVPAVKSSEVFEPSFTKPQAEDEPVAEEKTEVEETAEPEVEVETLRTSSNGTGGALLERFGTPGASRDPVEGKARTQALKDLRKQSQNELGIASIPDPNTFVGRTQDVRIKTPGGGNLKDITDLKSFGLEVPE